MIGENGLVSGSDSTSAAWGWLDELDAGELRDLIGAAVCRVDGLGDWLDVQHALRRGDADDLLAIVNRVMTPHRRFYDYREANEYAYDCADTVELLTHVALHGTGQLLPVIERAITLTTRAILKSDDSSGAQGDVVQTLLAAHATATRTAVPPLTQPEQTRLIKWVVSYRYSGKQDFFDPDIVAYAPALSVKSIEQYRHAITGLNLRTHDRYPLTRLAVLDRDRDAIVAAHGGEPDNPILAATLVDDLEEAGLHEDAVSYAKLGIAMEQRGWNQTLVTFLVDDALTRDDSEHAVTLRREWFTRFPTSTSFNLDPPA